MKPKHSGRKSTQPLQRAGQTDSARASRPRSRTEASPYADSLLDTCAAIPRLQTFSAAVRSAGLTMLLDGTGPITIFAPTDRAFERMPTEQRSAILADPTRLAALLRRHVVTGRVSAPGEARPRKVTPDFGDDLELTRSARGFRVNEARIVKTNIRATNGVIHAIDRVLDSTA